MGLNSRASGIRQQTKSMVKVVRFGLMEAYMKVTGKIICQMEEED
jgi:hypothetical protein